MLIGRNKEVKELLSLLESDKSEFVALYGRRRVGKTFLIRETFQYKFTFQHTGVLDASLSEQLSEFRESLYRAGMKKCAKPHSWYDAFHLLEQYIESDTSEKKVIFIDELPWMDTPKSNFIKALDHFWNGWATMRNDIILIVCGSASSWIINKVIKNYGGLHNRVTRQILLKPFTLAECEKYCEYRKIGFTRRQILESYMIMGGVPYYWSFLQSGQSLSQNVDRIFFSDSGELRYEFKSLYASLFRSPEPHISIISKLAKKKSGMLRSEILQETKLSDNATFIRAVEELVQCGFIRKYNYLGRKSKDAIYQLIDNFTLFYFNFMKDNVNCNNNFWTSRQNTPQYNVWCGLAFERVCLQHIEPIKRSLGFAAVISDEYSWTYKPKDSAEKGVQIDLLIDRNDQVINLCEMKFSNDVYTIDADEDARMRRRLSTFVRETKTKKSVFLTMITTYGLSKGNYSNDVQCSLTMDDLF